MPDTATMPPSVAPSADLMPAAPKSLAKSSILPDGIGEYGWIAGGGVGLVMFAGTHPVLGFLGGATLGNEAPRLFKPGERVDALCRIGVQGSAIAGSVMLEKHPVLGYLGGMLLGAYATSLVPGSMMHDLRGKAGK